MANLPYRPAIDDNRAWALFVFIQTYYCLNLAKLTVASISLRGYGLLAVHFVITY